MGKSKARDKRLAKIKNKLKRKKLKKSTEQMELAMTDENVPIDNKPKEEEAVQVPKNKSDKLAGGNKKAKKRKKIEVTMNDNDNSMTVDNVHNVTSKKMKTSSGDDSETSEVDTIKSKISDVKMMEQSFSVNASKISHGGKIKIIDIQQLLLFGLLHPSLNNDVVLPSWATLDPTCVKGIVVVLLKYVSSKTFEQNEECFPKLSSMFDVVLPFENPGGLMYITSPAYSMLTIAAEKNNEKTNEETTEHVHGKDYILTEVQLIKNEFIIPGLSKEAHDFVTIPKSSENVSTNSSSMFALDCEMCLSASGRELTRISLVDESHAVVYDVFVKPDEPITDYLTRYSGITEEILHDVTTTLKDVQEKLKEIIPPDAILVGHSLEFDFNALKFFHNKVIDTSVVYGDARGHGFKPGLKYLAHKYLKTEIQGNSNGHCSIEDARTCMKLVQLKIKNGPKFGGKQELLPEKTLLDYISENSTKKGVIIDNPSNAKQHSGSSDALPCVGDELVVSKVIKALPKYQFIWSQLHKMDTINSEKRRGDDEVLKSLLKQMDSSISKIHDNLQDGTLFVVLLGAADTSLIKSLRNQRAPGKQVKHAEKEAKRGLSFIKLVNRSRENSNS